MAPFYLAGFAAVLLILRRATAATVRRRLEGLEPGPARDREVRAVTSSFFLLTSAALTVQFAAYVVISAVRGQPEWWRWSLTTLLYALLLVQDVRQRRRLHRQLQPADPTEDERRRSRRTGAVVAVGAIAGVASRIVSETVSDPRTEVLVGGPLLLVAFGALLVAAWVALFPAGDAPSR